MDLNAEVDNISFAISCTKARCGQQYIGQTGRSMRERFGQHANYVDRNSEATGKHFNFPGHSKSDMRVTVIEKISKANRYF